MNAGNSKLLIGRKVIQMMKHLRDNVPKVTFRMGFILTALILRGMFDTLSWVTPHHSNGIKQVMNGIEVHRITNYPNRYKPRAAQLIKHVQSEKSSTDDNVKTMPINLGEKGYVRPTYPEVSGYTFLGQYEQVSIKIVKVI